MVNSKDSKARSADERRARAWAEVRDLLELQLVPLGRRVLSAVSPQRGERALDVGCGGGETAIALAEAVGADGSVLGIDLSPQVLTFAKEAASGLPQVRFVEGDAQCYPFRPGEFDVAFSRFGVMFFDDPVAAFDNIRRSLAPNGRLGFVCWRGLEENPLDMVPLEAALPVLTVAPDLGLTSPGPFSLADADFVHCVLSEAGFAEIEIEPHDELVGSGDIDAMLAVCLRVGALGKILREQPELREAAQPLVRAALATHDGPDGVKLKAATWIATARRALL